MHLFHGASYVAVVNDDGDEVMRFNDGPWCDGDRGV